MRIRQRVLNRQAHIARSQLRHNCTIDKLHHRMNDALRMHDNLNLIVAHAVKPLCFNDLKPFVDKAR